MNTIISILIMGALFGYVGDKNKHSKQRKFSTGDCIVNSKYENSGLTPKYYQIIVNLTPKNDYVMCQTDWQLQKWYACDVRDSSIVYDEAYVKIDCPFPFK